MNSPRPFVNTAELLPLGPLHGLGLLLRPLVERVCGFRVLNDIYARLQRPDMTPQRFCAEGLNHLGAEVVWPADAELAPLRDWQGPLVVMVNHPFGGTEALAFMLLLEHLRPGGWRLLANRVLAPTPELAPHLIGVDPFTTSSTNNRRGLSHARRFLASGGVLGAFPAGRVSGWSAVHDCVLDAPWSDHPARLAAAAGAAVALLHVPGGNSPMFLRVPLRWPRLRSLFLPRELLRTGKPAVRFRIGPLMPPAAVSHLVRAGNAGAKLRARCQMAGEAVIALQPMPAAVLPEVAPAGDPVTLEDEVARLRRGPELLFEQGRFVALLFRKSGAPCLFHEVSRLREIAFRDSGQGGGGTVDITPEDAYYHQLVLWDQSRQRLVGAYRLGFTEEVRRDHGRDALYSSHVFHIQPEFFQRIGPAIELTRSFIHPDYQKDPLALALLWRGLGATVAARPQIRSLFGSVSVPGPLSDASRAVIVEPLRRRHLEDATLRALIRPRVPFGALGAAHHLLAEAHQGEGIESVRDCIRAPNGTLRPIPPLIRHYLSLQARFIDFHVERNFGNALYCLLRVDLARAPRSHLRRFIGETAAARVLRDGAGERVAGGQVAQKIACGR